MLSIFQTSHSHPTSVPPVCSIRQACLPSCVDHHKYGSPRSKHSVHQSKNRPGEHPCNLLYRYLDNIILFYDFLLTYRLLIVFRASPAGLFEGYTGLTQWQAVVTVPLLGRIPGTHGHPTVACQNVMAIGRICTCMVEALHWADRPVPDSQRRLLWAGTGGRVITSAPFHWA